MYCRNCGAELPENASFCTSCGEKIEAKEQIANKAEQKPMKIKLPKGKQLWGIVGAVVAVLLIIVLLVVLVPKMKKQQSYIKKPVFNELGQRLVDPFELMTDEVYLLDLGGEYGKTLLYTCNPEYDGKLPYGEYYIGSDGRRYANFCYSDVKEKASSTEFAFGFDGDIDSVSVGDVVPITLELDGYHHQVINRMGYEFAIYSKDMKVKKAKMVTEGKDVPKELLTNYVEKVQENGREMVLGAYIVNVKGASLLSFYVEHKNNDSTVYLLYTFNSPLVVDKRGKYISPYDQSYDSRKIGETFQENGVAEVLESELKEEGMEGFVVDISDRLPEGAKTSKQTGNKEKKATTTKAAEPEEDTEGLIFPDSSTRKLKESEVQNLGSVQVQQAINEIYARNGYKFKKDSIREFFESFSWYKGVNSDMESVAEQFNETEKANMKLLTKYQ